MHLLGNAESFRDQMTIEIREEYERQQREMLLMEQKQAYHESLLADRAKEEAKQQKEKMIASERIRQESERAETEARKEAIRKDVRALETIIKEENVSNFRFQAENSLPPEPKADCPNITKIRFRKPTGDFMERRFTVDTKLKVRWALFSYQFSLSYQPSLSDFAQFRHCKWLPIWRVQTHLKFSTTRCKT